MCQYKLSKSGQERILMLIDCSYKTIGTFTFHGVGQGLMYTGSISSFPVNTCDTIVSLPCPPTLNFIYDCGTLNEKDELKKAVNGLPPHLDFIVISHLDADHINGLEILQGYYSSKNISNKIKVFLPYFDVETYKNVFIMHLIMLGIPKEEIIKYLNVYKKATIISNSSDNEPRDGQSDNVFDYYLIKGDIENPKEIHQYINWNFYFYNRNLADNLEDNITALQDKINTPQTYEELISLVNTEEIQNEYKNFLGEKNLTSLVLLHFPANHISVQTLLTGDVAFDEELISRINKHLQEPYILQIPHHGAKPNWISMPQDLWQKADKLVFSFGFPKSRFQHPDVKCFEDIISIGYPIDKIALVYQGDGDKIISKSFKYLVE